MLYLKRKEKTPITQDVIHSILKKSRLKPISIDHAGLSYTNDVSRVVCEDGVYFLKFFTDQWCDENAGEQEITAYSLLRELKIPVPELVLYAKSDAISPRNYAVLKPLEGDALIKGMPMNFSDKLLDQSLSILNKLSSIKGRFGFFKHNEAVHKTYSTHFDFINDTVFYAFKKLTDFGYDLYDLPVEFNKCKNIDINKKTYAFCHNDFTPKHIFIKNDDITGLIDFEWSVFSSELSDSALWLVSLAEYDAKKEHLQKILDYCNSLPESDKLYYYAARILILAAAWPHKNIKQPYYSQTCLDHANQVLKKGAVFIEDLIWPDGSGVLGAESWKN